jgi:hypothetical protein
MCEDATHILQHKVSSMLILRNHCPFSSSRSPAGDGTLVEEGRSGLAIVIQSCFFHQEVNESSIVRSCMCKDSGRPLLTVRAYSISRSWSKSKSASRRIVLGVVKLTWVSLRESQRRPRPDRNALAFADVAFECYWCVSKSIHNPKDLMCGTSQHMRNYKSEARQQEHAMGLVQLFQDGKVLEARVLL